jgi:hypothetical protein
MIIEDEKDLSNISSTNKPSIPLDIDFVPNNPILMTTDAKSLGVTNPLQGIKEESSFYETAKAEAYKFNATAQGIHSGYEKILEPSPLDDIAPAGWTSKTDVSKFINVADKNLKYLFDATGPKDQAYRLQRIMSEQATDEAIANGSFFAKLVGGVIGMISDPMTYIPIWGSVKYAKLSTTIFKSAERALPGSATYGVASAATEQLDKVNGTMEDFVIDAGIRTVFGTVLFGGIGASKNIADKMELWQLRGHVKNHIDGIDYKIHVNEEGKVTGFKAHDTTGGLSAEKVSFAQDIANSAFHKSGVFKLPYIGTGMKNFLSMPVLGSPLITLLQTPFKAANAYFDRVVDHSFVTKGIAEGEVAPKKFESMMNQSRAGISALNGQFNALHLERNGFNIKNRIGVATVNNVLSLKDTATQLFAKYIDKSGYVSRDAFYDEVQQVVHSGVASEHAAVNTAAEMTRKQLDTTYAAFRKAYNLPEDWMPSRTAEEYLMRVYDTPYMNTNETKWVQVISNWLKEADVLISERMQPINDLERLIAEHKENHLALINRPNRTDKEIKESVDQLIGMRANKKALEETLQNELRSNADLQLHVEDWHALSADEAKQIETLTKRQNIAKKEYDKYKKIVADLKAEIKEREAQAVSGKTVKTAKSNLRKSETGKLYLAQEEAKLAIAEKEYYEESESLQVRMHNGEIPSRLFTKKPDSFQYEFKNPNNRLRFRDVYGTENNPFTAEQHAKAYYDTILNQTAEDTINQVMGRFTGNRSESHLKSRTLLVPDSLLYENNFMTKDLMAKISNYTTYLNRRTHLKNVFNDVTIDGGIEPLVAEVGKNHEEFRVHLNNKKQLLENKLSDESLSAKDKKKLEKNLASIDKELITKRKEFEKVKGQMQHVYEKMMGIQRVDKKALQIKSGVMSLTAMSNLAFVPFLMVTEFGSQGLQHGIWPLIRDGLYPLIESLGGIIKSKDSEALRKAAPSINLALQDIGKGYADRNWSMHDSPYANLGKIVGGLERAAHFSANITGTNIADNGLQHLTAAISQGELMRIIHAWKAGKMTPREGTYIRTYGIDLDKYGDRMLEAFTKNGGGKTKIGGYQSNFWHWEDLEASKEFGDAVFRAVKDTNIQAGIADSPFWTDNNSTLGIIGSIIKGFNGWMYASINRYVIPSMQQADAQKLSGVIFMIGLGALVDPMKRFAKGLSPYEDNVTPQQIAFSALNNSGYLSYFMTVLADANLLSSDRLLGDLKNSKYKDRARVGLLGPSVGTANNFADLLGVAATNEWNKQDMKKMARMIPPFNASWANWLSNTAVDSLDVPATRRQARAANE